MSRASVTIRDATDEDLPLITQLATEVGGITENFEVGARRLVDALGRDRTRFFDRLLHNPEVRVVVAEDLETGSISGIMVLSVDEVSVALDLPAAFISYLVVAKSRRHRGVGRALLAEATTFAEELGAEHVIVGVTTTAREVNRYFARLGFAPLVLRRIASVPALRRSLGMAEPVADIRAGLRRRSLGHQISTISRAPRLPRARAKRSI